MRIQATALMTLAEKAMLEELATEHRTSQTIILRAGLHQFKGNPEHRQVWIDSANQAFRQEIGDTP